MKSLAVLTAVLALGLSLSIGDAEAARRLGGGMSSGMQRQAISPAKPTPMAPSQGATAPKQATNPQAAPQPGMAPQAQPKRSWMGPLAGLAAGLGLAALASHFGFGEAMANMMLIGLLVVAALAVVGFLMRRKAGPAAVGGQGLQYAGAGADYGRQTSAANDYQPAGGSANAAPVAEVATGAGHIPADFDVAGFLRSAKVNFIRLQAANDAGNLDDIREFTSPEMFGEIKLGLAERGNAQQETDVVSLEAEVLDVSEEANRYVVSVHFHGLIREDKGANAEPFAEVWHLTKPRDGSKGWVLAGIQQVQ